MTEVVGSGGYNGQIRVAVPAPEPEPEEWGEVRQVTEPPLNSIPVRIDDTVRVRSLPAKRAVMTTFVLPVQSVGVQPTEVIPGDMRIKFAKMTVDPANPGRILLGTMEQLTGTSVNQGYLVGAGGNVPPWEGTETPVYAVALTAGTNLLSVRLEYWAD